MYYAKKYPEEMAVSPGCEIIVLLILAYLDAILNVKLLSSRKISL